MRVAELIQKNKETIMQAWEAACHAHLQSAREVSRAVRRDSMPKLIDALVSALLHPGQKQSEAAREHGEDRANLESYSLPEMIYEYRLFRQVIFRVLRAEIRLDDRETDFINDFLDSAIQKATDEYVEVDADRSTKFEENSLRLKETESQLSLALANAQAGTWSLDISTQRIFGSAQTAKIYGVKTIDGDLSNAIRELVSDEDQKRIADAINHSIKTGEPMIIDFKIRRADGSIRWSHARGSVTYDPAGNPVRMSGIQTDITEQKEDERRLREAKEEAERANSAKSAFLANMSHEIRSPLGSIMGFAELLKSQDLSKEDVHRHLSVIDRNAKHLLTVIDDILDLSKVEAGRMSLEKIDFSLTDLLDDFNSIMSFRARDKGIEFLIRKATPLPERVISDPTRIRQILNNVVGNAIKFTRKGLVQLAVGLQGDTLTFTVSDTGIGIDPEAAKKLFQPFAQADVSTTRKFGGTGLGLVLTKRLSEALGGSFTLERTAPGVGSVFKASVEVEIPKDQHVVPHAIVVQPTKRDLSGVRVLLVDDSADNQALFSLVLKSSGASVDVARDGFEGVNLARLNDYDVVLMDVQMPKMDGHQATKILREGGYKTPIVALTAHAMNEERERATMSGFTDYLSKPVSRDQLLATISRFKNRPTPPPELQT